MRLKKVAKVIQGFSVEEFNEFLNGLEIKYNKNELAQLKYYLDNN